MHGKGQGSLDSLADEHENQGPCPPLCLLWNAEALQIEKTLWTL